MSLPFAYSYEFHLPATVEASFELFADPRRLDELTPRWFALRPRSSGPHVLAPGVEIAYRFRWRGLPLGWVSRIVEWQPPYRLTYEQVRGPYRFFRHEHDFRETDGGTRVLDRVTYRVAGGSVVARWLVTPDLARVFTYRARAAGRLLGGKPEQRRADSLRLA